MAKSLRSKRRRKNKQVLRQKYKPKYEAQLKSIVANFQGQTDKLLEACGNMDIENNVEVVDPTKETKVIENNTIDESTIDDNMEDAPKVAEQKHKIPRVDIKKLTKFMSQRKLRQYQGKLKRDQKASAKLKPGQKKKKSTRW